MHLTIKDQLRRLIKSMTKSEKRNFKVYAQRVESNKDSKFVQLFDLIDAQEESDDAQLVEEVADGNSTNLSNIKRHLYQQLLISLRLLHINKQTDISIRQQIDFARILYGKGHYLDALRILDKIKGTAKENNYDILLLEILEFQKLIEARHVTLSRQIKNKMDELVRDSQKLSEINLHTSLQANINIQIQGYYILNGHARTEQQKSQFANFWEAVRARVNDYPPAPATFFERINRFQASMWRNYIRLDFDEALTAAQNSYNLFRLESEMPIHDPDLFVRCCYYVNAFAYLQGDLAELKTSYRNLAAFTSSQKDSFNDNSQLILFVYEQLSYINLLIHEQKWAEADSYCKKMRTKNRLLFNQLPDHRVNLFRYKFAAIAFAAGNFEQTEKDLQLIMNAQPTLLREDLLINTRLLLVMTYYETGDFYLADYALTNLQRIIRRNKFAGQVHTITIAGLRQLIRGQADEHKDIFLRLRKELTPLLNDAYERKLFRFIDVLHWVNGKL